MAKKLIRVVKLQLEAGKATPAPPVGPALGQYGVNLMEFCKKNLMPLQLIKQELYYLWRFLFMKIDLFPL